MARHQHKYKWKSLYEALWRGHLKVRAWVLPVGFWSSYPCGCARGDGLGLAGLALQFLLRPPGGARRALRAGMGGGAEHLFKAASALVRPAYFRLKGAEKQTCT